MHTYPPLFSMFLELYVLPSFCSSSAFVSTQAGIDYLNDHLEDVGRIAFFLNESVPDDSISDIFQRVVDFYLDGNRAVTPATVHSIIDVSAMQ
jgi:hypothetical protein